MSFHSQLTAICGGIALLAAQSAAYAQPPRPPQMPGGLFGVAVDRSAADSRPPKHALDFTLHLVEGNDSDVPLALATSISPDTFLGGYSTMLFGSGEYRWEGKRLQLVAAGNSGFRYYNALEDVRSLNHSGGLTVAAPIGRRTSILATQSVTFSPSQLFALFPTFSVTTPADAVPGVEGVPDVPVETPTEVMIPTEIVGTTPEYRIDDSQARSYATAMTVTRGLSRRSRLSFSGNFAYTDFTNTQSVRPDLHWLGVGGEYANHVSRNLELRLGYRYRNGSFGAATVLVPQEPASVEPLPEEPTPEPFAPALPDISATEHVFDAGLEYTLPLSGTRLLVFTANGGTSRISSPTPDVESLMSITGDAGLSWHFSPGWQVRGAFRRGVEYAAGLSEPVNVSGYSAEIAGLLTRRLDVLATTRYASGRSALFRDSLSFDTRGADVRLRFALMRELAVFGEYLYYVYDFTEGARLAPGIPTGLKRNGIRVGLTVLVPAVRR